jgi:hypothetical protein
MKPTQNNRAFITSKKILSGNVKVIAQESSPARVID